MIARTKSHTDVSVLNSDTGAASESAHPTAPTVFYHGTTVSNARSILKDGPNIATFYVTPSCFEAIVALKRDYSLFHVLYNRDFKHMKHTMIPECARLN